MRTNIKTSLETHEGGRAATCNVRQQLERSVLSCLLWENTFYEDGIEIAARIRELVQKNDTEFVSSLAVKSRSEMKLRHIPLWLCVCLGNRLQAETLSAVIQRADELCEFLSLYWKDGRKSLSAQIKKGLAAVFPKFSAYDLAKYNQDGPVKLRDVLFLCHAKPKDPEQADIWKKLINGQLESPDTWEVQLSAGKDKKETWERLLREKKLGALALIRNLRNMQTVNVDSDLIKKSLIGIDAVRVLPYRFIAAARYAPQYEPELEQGLFRAIEKNPKLFGKTLLVIDVSGSMDDALSGKSDISRLDAACGLAICARELCSDIRVVTFSDRLAIIPPRRGFALRDSIVQSQDHLGTWMAKSLSEIEDRNFDRCIVITDEQVHDSIPNPLCKKSYLVNVASYKNGVGYGPWTHLTGFSERLLDFISAGEDSSYFTANENGSNR
jgi:60 kDa SS-A/Ro ribonucleoprotein